MEVGSDRAKGTRSARIPIAACLAWLIFGSTVALPQSLQDQAWEILQTGQTEKAASNRGSAVAALGLLRDDPRAVEFAEKALADKKTGVRAAAANGLGQMGSRSSIPLLKEALADKQPRVCSAAANSLLSLGDPAGYDFYYEVLTGERKSGEGIIPEKKKLISDRREVTLLALGTAAGFAPYAGYAWMIYRELSHDYVSPIRINALKKLENDRDPQIEKGLLRGASDKHWRVRVAALSTIARHEEPSLIPAIEAHMKDKKAAVRYTAAAAVLRLSARERVDDTAAGKKWP